MRTKALAVLLILGTTRLVAGAQPLARPVTTPAYPWPRPGQILLDGPWELAFSQPPPAGKLPESLDKLDWFSTTVPTDVHWALYRAGRAPHPYVGLGAQKLRWVEDKAWWFRKRFSVPKEFYAQQIRLAVDGVDYYAWYWLNGKYLGRSEGAFGASKMIVDNLRCGQSNELIVRLECGGYKLDRQGGDPPASLVKSELWSGWRLGARDFNTIGIWQPPRLLANGWPCLERPFVRTVELGGKRGQSPFVRSTLRAVPANGDCPLFPAARLRASVEVCAVRPDGEPCDVTFVVRPKDGRGLEIRACARVKSVAEMVLAECDLDVPRPRLWWPNGLGEQPTYEAEVLLSRNGRPVDRLVVPFGIRTIERRRGPMQRVSYEMREWIFHVNGQAMFVKGTNWMPIDALADVAPDRYEWALSLAHDAGIQMIRIWGGGILEPDVFYELCDRYGIMVWQDFPLTCGWRAQRINRRLWSDTVAWTVFRLRNHPSLAFWCGGNEFPPDDPANSDLVGMIARQTRILDGTRPFMAASPDEGDHHLYYQWDASWAWQSELVKGPFVSEWGSHGMPSSQTYREMVSPGEANAVIGPTLLKMSEKLMAAEFPEITSHWVEFNAGRLPQMLARGSAFDQLATVPLARFSEAVAAGAAEFYKYSAEAGRLGYPQNGGLLFWVWKRPWPVVGIQIVDGLGQPLAVYYDVKRAYSSPWPCLQVPYLNFAPGETVSMKTAVLSELHRPDIKGCWLSLRVLGPDLRERQARQDLGPLDVPSRPEAVAGPTVSLTIPGDFARQFFFALLELHGPDRRLLARNPYWLRCPAKLEDAKFRAAYRAKPQAALPLSDGPWLRPQLEKHPTRLALKILSAKRESPTRGTLVAELANVGRLPAVMAGVEIQGRVRYVADDAYFWLEPGESRRIEVRMCFDSGQAPHELRVAAHAWNATEYPELSTQY